MPRSQDNNEGKIIGFDLDGVIIDHTQNKIRLAKARGFDLNAVQVQGDVFKKYIKEEIRRDIQKFLYEDLEISLSPLLMIGALEGLSKIRESGIPYFLISRRKKFGNAIKLLNIRGLWPDFFHNENT